MTYEPDYLKPWQEMINYQGENLDDYYIAAMRLFKCSPLERSNFEYIKHQVLGCFEKPSDALLDNVVMVAHFTDEVHSLRYYVLIHRTADRALKMADMLVSRAMRKGSLDPEKEHQYALVACNGAWRNATRRDRIQFCTEAGVSIFAARRRSLGDDATGDKLRALLIDGVADGD